MLAQLIQPCSTGLPVRPARSVDILRASRLIENDNRRRSRVRAVHRHASEKESHADQE